MTTTDITNDSEDQPRSPPADSEEAAVIPAEDLVILDLEREGRDMLWEKTRQAHIKIFEKYSE